MKRSIIAAAILLLLLSSATYATPRWARRRAPRARFWSTVLCWLGHSHHHGYERCASRHEYGYVPPGHRGRPERGCGWHWGWDNGRHNGWERGRHNGWDGEDTDRGDRHGSGRPRDGEHGNGRGRGHGRG